MSFLTRPYDHTRTPRTSRDIARAACAIERYEPARPSLGHRLIAPACLLATLFLILILTLEKLQ